MNRLLRILFVLSLPVAAMLIFVVAENRSGSPSRVDTLAGEFVSSFVDHGVTIQQYVQARLPQNFQAEMSKASYGNTPYYITTYRANPAYPGQKPLPYPPNDVWCVRLKSANVTAPQMVIMALHQDIFNADWVMHEVIDPEAAAAAVGCQFSKQ